MSDPTQILDASTRATSSDVPVASASAGRDPGVSALLGLVASGGYTTQVRSAFMLGWSISELKGRIQTAAIAPDAAMPDPAGATDDAGDGTGAAAAAIAALPPSVGDAYWRTSAWRINFARLSLLHAELFPASATPSTPYDPQPGQPPYLYPGPPDDYADVGLSKTGANGKPILDGFALREATRRALNCLALLYADPSFSLPGRSQAAPQARLIQAILGRSPAATTPGVAEPGATAGPPAGASAAGPEGASVDAPSADDLATARATVTRQTLLFLEAWDAYLRESFFDGGLAAQDEAKLVAFEAGRAMANLSWAITVATLPAETISGTGATSPAAGSGPALEGIAAGASGGPQWAGVWQNAFRDQDISRLQRQLAVLATSLDNDAVALARPALTAAARPAGADDPTLPGAALQAVIRSLDNWQRAIHWLTDPSSPRPTLTAPLRQQIRLALVEQVGIWQALVLGQEDLRAHTARNVVQQIQQDVIARLEAVAAQQGIVDVAANASRGLRGEVGKLLVGLPLLVYIGTAAGLLAIVGLGVGLALHGPDPLSLSVPSILVALAGGLGLHQASTARSELLANAPSTEGSAGNSNSLAGRMSRLFGAAGDDVLQAFEQGYKQIQLDLADLGHAVAVTAPLVEYFVLNEAFAAIRDDYAFLTEIIWDNTERREEVMRVAAAAFGPIGLFAQARFQGSTDGGTAGTRMTSPGSG